MDSTFSQNNSTKVRLPSKKTKASSLHCCLIGYSLLNYACPMPLQPYIHKQSSKVTSPSLSSNSFQFVFKNKCSKTKQFSLWLQIISLTEVSENTDSSQITSCSASNFTNASTTYSAQERHQGLTSSCFQYVGLGDKQEEVSFPRHEFCVSEHRKSRKPTHIISHECLRCSVQTCPPQN